MRKNKISTKTLTKYLETKLQLAGLFAEENVREFIEHYGIKYYTTDISKLDVLVITRILSGKPNAFVYEDKESIHIYLLDELIIEVNKKDSSYLFKRVNRKDNTEPIVDERIMDFTHDLKQQLKTLTKTALLEELLEDLSEGE